MKYFLSIIIIFLSISEIKSQDHLLYQNYIRPPVAPNQTSDIPSPMRKAGFAHVLINGDQSISFLSDNDTIAIMNKEIDLNRTVYYGNSNEREIIMLDSRFLPDHYTSFEFINTNVWNIHEEFIVYNNHKAYMATNEEGVKVYFVPDIPISFGPTRYSGLPGLIVSVETGYSALELIDIKLSEEFEIPEIDIDSMDFLSNEEFIEQKKDATMKYLMSDEFKQEK